MRNTIVAVMFVVTLMMTSILFGKGDDAKLDKIGRYQVVAVDDSNDLNPPIIIKCDTATGKTWRLDRNAMWIEVKNYSDYKEHYRLPGKKNI